MPPAHDIRDELTQGLKALHLIGNERCVPLLLDYAALLRQWNTACNLMARGDSPVLVSRHLLDSLAVHPFLHGATIVDAGSGAGLPGIPLAILDPARHFILLDSNSRKTHFLFQVKTRLKLDNVSIVNCRLEHYQSKVQIDMVLCRALAPLQRLVSMSRHLLNQGAVLLAMQGRYPKQEIERIPAGFVVRTGIRLEIPGSSAERHLIELQRAATDVEQG